MITRKKFCGRQGRNERTTEGMGRTDERGRENCRRERDRENNNLRCRDGEEEREC